jgi:outer membrane protein assembly factor BamB
LDGKLLWELGPMSEICIPAPVAAHGLLFVSSGYEFGNKTRPIYAVKPGAAGKINLRANETSNDFIAWSQPSAGSYTPSPLIYGDRMYVLYSQGFFACFDARTGAEVYGRKRLGGTYSASPWAYDGKVFCLSEDGTTTVIQAGPEFKVLGKNELGEVSLATPALAEKSLLLRTQSKLYCIRVSAKGAN